MPAAAPTFSTITCWPRIWVRYGVKTRAMTSNAPPAANGTTSVTGRFGQSCAGSNYYRLPSPAELRTMLAHWAALVPHPAFDYTYSWGRQDSSCPTLVDSADLQAVMRTHNQS